MCSGCVWKSEDMRSCLGAASATCVDCLERHLSIKSALFLCYFNRLAKDRWHGAYSCSELRFLSPSRSARCIQMCRRQSNRILHKATIRRSLSYCFVTMDGRGRSSMPPNHSRRHADCGVHCKL